MSILPYQPENHRKDRLYIRPPDEVCTLALTPIIGQFAQKVKCAGYTVECALKALILHQTPDADKPEKLKRLTRGATMHRPDVLLGELRHVGGAALPLEIARRMRRFDWTTDLRYETGRRDTAETIAFLKTARAIDDWVEGQLP